MVCLLVLAVEGIFLIEQPSSSLLMRHMRFVWFQDVLESLNIRDPGFIIQYFFMKYFPIPSHGSL